MNRVAVGYLSSFLVLLPAVVCGQSNVSEPHPIRLSGRIVDVTASQIPGASVSLTFFDAKEILFTVKSDQEGIFAYPAVKPGNYTLKIQSAGFRPFNQLIEVTGKNDIDLGRVTLDIGNLCDVAPGAYEDPRFYHPAMFLASGRVVDNTNKPIPNAVVVFVSFCHGSRASKTDAKGIFSLRVPQDLSSIEVQALGFRTLTTLSQGSAPTQ